MATLLLKYAMIVFLTPLFVTLIFQANCDIPQPHHSSIFSTTANTLNSDHRSWKIKAPQKLLHSFNHCMNISSVFTDVEAGLLGSSSHCLGPQGATSRTQRPASGSRTCRRGPWCSAAQPPRLDLSQPPCFSTTVFHFTEVA